MEGPGNLCRAKLPSESCRLMHPLILFRILFCLSVGPQYLRYETDYINFDYTLIKFVQTFPQRIFKGMSWELFILTIVDIYK